MNWSIDGHTNDLGATFLRVIKYILVFNTSDRSHIPDGRYVRTYLVFKSVLPNNSDYLLRKEKPARFQSPHEAYRLGDGLAMLLWKVVSEQGVKTRSREGVGVTDAGKVGSAVYCYVFRVLAGKVGSAGNICVFVFWHFVNYP